METQAQQAALPLTTDHRLALALKRRHEQFCGTGYVMGLTDDDRTAVFVSMRCHAWSCPRCGPLKAAYVRRRIQAGKPTRFITLTHRPARGETQCEAIASMARDFPRLVAALRRKFGPFEYVRVLELTKAGEPHYHIAYVGSYIPQKFLSRLWSRLHGAPIVWIKHISDGPRALAYLSKYLTKLQDLLPILARKTRLVSYSKGWPSASQDGAAEELKRYTKWLYLDHGAKEVFQDILLSDVHIDKVDSLAGTIEFSGAPEVLRSIRTALTQRGAVPAHIVRDTNSPAAARSPPRRRRASPPNQPRLPATEQQRQSCP